MGHASLYPGRVWIVLRRVVLHLHYGHAEVHSQSVDVEKPEETQHRQRVSGRNAGKSVHSAQPLERMQLTVTATVVVYTGHLVFQNLAA